MRLQPPHSLRSRLLWLLLAIIVVTAVVQAVVAYRTARDEADEIFDYHMQQTALSLRSGLPWQAAVGHDDDEGKAESYEFVVQVWTQDGLRVFQSARAAIPRRETKGFSDVPARGTTYRVFTMQSGTQVIQVAQDMSSRREMAGTLALRTAAPIAVMAPLSMLLVWWVISSSLAPVQRVRRQVSQRQADDLDEVSEAGLPDEVRPLVHELNLLFARVRQAFDAQKSFVADAAHELRSPLAALKLQVQGLQRASDDGTRELAVARLHAGIDRATRLVEQLLVLARHQASAAGGQRPQPVALAGLARQAVGDIAAAAQSRRIDVGVSHADEGSFPGHPDAVRILLRNLLDNAVKYTPEDGTVDVEIRRRTDAWALEVHDSGPGIDEADRERVLDRFYRVAGSQATGSGLGLAIVKSVVDLHGGTLALDRSTRLGGLCVSVRFPAGA
ncbi:MAG TPA: ATP-binding protein [Burkholderiaceae bacterium]|nr:ATP-binding protein [Burkholderiaceae bacterium]